MPMVAQKTIVEACLQGLRTASRLYDCWSGGIPLYEAPEWLLQCEIARSLANQCPWVTVESSVRWLINEAGAEPRGRPARNPGGRIDVVVWSSAEMPRYLIEVKKAWDARSLNEDAQRLRSTVNRGGSLHAGLLVAYATAATGATLGRRFSNIENNCRARVLETLPARRIDPEDETSWLWSGAVFRVNRR